MQPTLSNNNRFLFSCSWSTVEFNAPPDTIQIILEVVFKANHLTNTDRQEKYTNCFVLFHCIMLCYCYGSVSDQLGPSAYNKFDLI